MKRNALSLFLTLSVFVFTFSACKKDGWPCINGKGELTTEQRTVTEFSRIEQLMDADVYVTQGSTYSITLEAQDNLLDDIKTEVKGGELKIYNKRCFKHHKPIKVYITMPIVAGVTLAGSGNIYLQNRIESNDLYVALTGSGSVVSQDSVIANGVEINLSGSGNIALVGRFDAMSTGISGSGNIALKGKATSNGLHISGSGSLEAFDMPVNDCTVDITGSGDARINVLETLDVHITGSGNVYFKGMPSVTTNITGSGSVVSVP